MNENIKELGIIKTVGELKKILEKYPDDTCFYFRNQPVQEFLEIEENGEVYVCVNELQ